MARGHQRLENLLIRQAVDRGEIAEETALQWYGAGKKKDAAEKKVKTAKAITIASLGMAAPLVAIGGYIAAKKQRAAANMQKDVLAGAADQAGMEGEQRLIEQEAERKRQQLQQELLSRYGYSSTIKTSGRGVLGQAPVQYRQLLGA